MTAVRRSVDGARIAACGSAAFSGEVSTGAVVVARDSGVGCDVAAGKATEAAGVVAGARRLPRASQPIATAAINVKAASNDHIGAIRRRGAEAAVLDGDDDSIG